MTEISATCKLFLQLSRKNKQFIKKFTDSKKLFSKDKFLCEYYYVALLSVWYQLFIQLKDINEDELHLAKSVLLDRLYHSIVPFRVWNHIFLCNRLQYESNMCKFSTKMYIEDKKISDLMNEKLFVQIGEYFPDRLQFRVMLTKIYLYIQMLLLITRCLG